VCVRLGHSFSARPSLVLSKRVHHVFSFSLCLSFFVFNHRPSCTYTLMQKQRASQSCETLMRRPLSLSLPQSFSPSTSLVVQWFPMRLSSVSHSPRFHFLEFSHMFEKFYCANQNVHLQSTNRNSSKGRIYQDFLNAIQSTSPSPLGQSDKSR